MNVTADEFNERTVKTASKPRGFAVQIYVVVNFAYWQTILINN